MRIIIKESKLDMLMTDFLNGWLENKHISNFNNFIVISRKTELDDEWTDYMEYDFSDGRLWINNDLKKFMSDLFPLTREQVMDFVKAWFENKFGEDIKYVE